MGNRGRIHKKDRTLKKQRFELRRWICCCLEFRGRHRDVWGSGYTELFFLDEVTAFAAGHRPCFECRHTDAATFANAWQRAFKLDTRPRAPAMDERLHAERLIGSTKRLHRWEIEDLPDGAFIGSEGVAFVVRGSALLRWTPQGYVAGKQRPRDTMVDVLTPPAILAVLAAGYHPRWHPTAD